MRENRLFIVANRLPVCISGEGADARIEPASGGLVSAVNSYLEVASGRFDAVFWAGVPGCSATTWHEASTHLQAAPFTYLPVTVAKESYDKYYNGFANSVLWPLFHYFPSYAEYDSDEFAGYLSVNAQFAAVLARNCREGDTVWIHDYHLLPLAGMLRKLLPGLTIGFFLHIPFPSYELVRLLPKKWQEALVQGMLGADLVGFHTIDYASHFLKSVQMICGLEGERNIIRYGDRLVKVDVFPISIDYRRFNDSFAQEEVRQLRETLRSRLPGTRILFSVDRLDYTKGVHNRLRAYELFLQQHPSYHEKVVFIIVVVPSRDTIPRYVERKRMIDELISRINSRIGTLHWQPVIYRYHSLPFSEMTALYSACDLALITPLRDGMNLVAKEFVASRKDKRGVLVISEMAGAARELTDALMINPNDIQEMAEKIREGLEMKEDEQEARMEKMQQRIRHYDVTAWAEDFMTGLKNIKLRQQSFQEIFLDEYARKQLLDSFRSAGRRLLLLDYDGTLVSYAASPDLAVPAPSLLQLLQSLASKDNTDVYLISGRSSLWLDRYFGALPIHLIAEHGARRKEKGGPWNTEVQTHSEWKAQVHPVMEMYARRCPNTFIEEKEFSIVWHYRKAEPEQGRLKAGELVSELQDCIRNRNLQVLPGNKIVEVRNSGIDKGTAIKKILSQDAYDFVFAVGDDKTDEDMFRILVGKENCYTVKVGPNASYAQYNLLTPAMVISLLEGINNVPVRHRSDSTGSAAPQAFTAPG